MWSEQALLFDRLGYLGLSLKIFLSLTKIGEVENNDEEKQVQDEGNDADEEDEDGGDDDEDEDDDDDDDNDDDDEEEEEEDRNGKGIPAKNFHSISFYVPQTWLKFSDTS